MGAAVLLVNVRKQLRHFELAVDLALERRITVLLGPSGHGKTTVLNIVAGITDPDEGIVTLGGCTLFDSSKATSLGMDKREIGFVFQDYALFPHMSVFKNVAYGLKGLPYHEINRRVDEELERMDISSLRDVRPDQLSGGQRQRVAVARTLATRPKAMLLDEPLGALDMQLRARVRSELRSLLSQLDVPTIVVSHDPLDAVGLGDEVVVLEHGRVVQQGSYEALLAAPRTEFVADFVDSNAYRATMRHLNPNGESVVALLDKVEVQVILDKSVDDLLVVIHPWDVSISLKPTASSIRNAIQGNVISVCPMRDRVRVLLDIGVPITAELSKTSIGLLGLERGLPVIVSFKTTAVNAARRH